jgi:soluble lytic murein transglycosylase-like protein
LRALLALGCAQALACAEQSAVQPPARVQPKAEAVATQDRTPDAGASLPVVAAGDDSEAFVAPTPAPPRELHEWSTEERARIGAAQHFVQRAARKQGVDPTLINAVIWIESNFQPRAHGRLGPRGLMQLMPRTARYAARQLHRVYRPYDADFNIQAGTFYLGRMLALFHGDVRLALASYNAGPAAGIAARDSGGPLPQQIQDYVDSVLVAQHAFARRGLPRASEKHAKHKSAASKPAGRGTNAGASELLTDVVAPAPRLNDRPQAQAQPDPAQPSPAP